MNHNYLQVFDKLPPDWRKTSLGESLPISYGKGLPETKRQAGAYPVYGSSGQVGTHSRALTTKPSLIIGRKGAVGAVYYSVMPCWPIDTVYYVQEQDGVHLRFFEYLLKGLGLSRLDRSTAVPGLSRDDYNATEVAIAPLHEQRRIVEEIEKQFSRLDEAVTNLKRVKANLKHYKAAVLKAAVEGKLTEQWRKEHPDVEPASKLLERILAERRAKWEQAESAKLKTADKAPDDRGRTSVSRALPRSDSSRLPTPPSGWCWVRVEDLGKVQLGRQRAPKYHSGAHMRPYLRVQNVFEDRIDLGDVMEMDFPPSDYEKYRLEPGDILLNEGQSPELLGRPAIYRGELPDACFTNTLIRYQVAPPIQPEFPLLVFRSYMRSGRFTREGTITTNIAHLSAGRFAKIEFPLPSLKEQAEIIKEAERHLSVIEMLEKEVDINLARAERLRQSILKKAFSGQLVPQQDAAEDMVHHICTNSAFE